MSAVGNLFRDMIHVSPGQSQVTFGNADLLSSSTLRMNNSSVVYQTTGFANHNLYTAAWPGFNTIRSAGLLISQPVVDDTPYRVKAYVRASLSTPYIIVGLGPASATGTDDVITKYTLFPIGAYTTQEYGLFDDVINVPAFTGAEANRPIAFGVGISANSLNNTQAISYSISVQNLAKTAPQFASSMS